MNYLAHILLSGVDPDLIIGNFIGDHVKGNDTENFPVGIRNGILLHREIDYYTDTHPVVHSSKELLRPVFSKYAPVVADVYYDHFLATNWEQMHHQSLRDFTSKFYKLTKQYSDILPKRTNFMLTHMIENDWLTSYSEISGISNVLISMSKRTNFKSNMELGGRELVKNYNSLEEDFLSFFPELQKHTQLFIQELENNR